MAAATSRRIYRITNVSTSTLDTHLLIVARGLPAQFRLDNASGTTSAGDPYLRVFLDNGVLLSGKSILQSLVFKRNGNGHAPALNFNLVVLSGQGNP